MTEMSQPDSQQPLADTNHNHDMTHDMSHMQDHNPPTDGRNPDYSQGRQSSHTGSMHNHTAWSVRINQLEQLNDDENTTTSEGIAWYGTDSQRLRLTWDIEHNVQDAHQNLSITWQKPLDSFWNYELGLAFEDEQTWLKVNLNGLLPYKFEFDTSLLVNDQAHSLFLLEGDYDLRLTQRWVLQPSVKTRLYSHTDAANQQGIGFAELKTGLRLRYEMTRRFAPYLGIQQQNFLGKTSELRTQQGLTNHETTWLAGVRWWF